MFHDEEWRKLHWCMDRKEIKILKEIIHKGGFNFTYYSEGRVMERHISKSDVYETIRNGEIVEFHYKNGIPRVLLRGRDIVNGEAICVVLDIKNFDIVTIYRNSYDDLHKTIHTELYSLKNIINYI